MIEMLSAPTTEEEIISHWKYQDKIYISMICITFNQDIYVRDAIDSLLAQKCEYKFEIVIHDDASNDETKKILEDYKIKFPSLIRLVIQDENQYSKNKRITPIAVSSSHGIYITLCEGDDYWVDCNKVQNQITHMLNNKDVELCFTSGYHLSNEKLTKHYNYGKQVKKFTCHEVIKYGGSFIPTVSWMMHRRVFDELPNWFYTKTTVGDYFLQILASMNGGALYLSERTVVYRVEAVGSWSTSNSNGNAKHREKSSLLYLYLMEIYPKFSKDFYFVLNVTNFKYVIRLVRNSNLSKIKFGIKLLSKYFFKSSLKFLKINRQKK